MTVIHVLHENAAWAAPLFDALERRALPYCDRHLAEGLRDLTEPPPFEPSVDAVRVDVSAGFELCPADVCQTPVEAERAPRFQTIAGFDHPLTDRRSIAYTYDVNTNTNYDPEAGAAAGISGMAALADLPGRELVRLRTPAAAASEAAA